MKKIAFPLGEDFDQMGHIFEPKGDSFMDPQRETETGPDAFVAQKFTGPDENQIPFVNVEEGMTGHMDVEDNSYNLADDDKEALIEIWDEEDNPIASFACDVARTYQDQVTGLQSYSELPKNAGLVFPYSKPKDVMYHMGTVSFPIDIIFVGADHSIKKIYRNIQPGTLGTFGCAGVKHVLEICGGLSDRLGICEGHFAFLEDSKDRMSDLKKTCSFLGIEKDIVLAHSNFARSGISNWKGFPILTLKSSENITKTASNLKSVIAHDLASKFSPEESRVSLFYFDPIIDNNILVHKLSNLIDENKMLSRTIEGEVVLAKSSRLVELDKFEKTGTEAVLNSTSVLYKFLPYDQESDDLMAFFAEESESDFVVVATSFKNKDLFKKMLLSRASYSGHNIPPHKIKIIDVPAGSDATNLIDAGKEVFSEDIVLFAPDSIMKSAGVPVPDDTKNKARKAYKYFEQATKSIMTSLENLQKNLAEYEKIKQDVDQIPNTKGQYNQSAKRNTKVIREYLLRIRDGIKILNEIKDVSTTMEIIDALANSAKEASSAAEEVFDLVDLIETSDFPILLGERTNVYERTVEDLISTIERAKEYINTNILGLVVLSN